MIIPADIAPVIDVTMSVVGAAAVITPVKLVVDAATAPVKMTPAVATPGGQ